MVNTNIATLFLLYLLQGIPYGIQGRFLPIYLRLHNVTLTNITLMKLLFLPWIFKGVWAFIFDSIKFKQLWLLTCMFGLSIFYLAIAFTDPLQNALTLAVLFFAINICASSQDIAVDGLAIQILSETQLAAGNVAQVVGYKTGSLIGGGAFILLSSLSILTWKQIFVLLSVIYMASIYVIWLIVPKFKKHTNDERTDTIRSGEQLTDTIELALPSSWKHRLTNLIKTPGTTWMMAFVLLYKLGEQASLTMLPLYLVDKTIAFNELSVWLTFAIGIVSESVSICGSLISGWLISSGRIETFALVRKLCRLRIIPLSIAVWIVLNYQQFYHDTTSPALLGLLLCMYVLLLFSGMLTTSTFTLMMRSSQLVPIHSQATHYSLLTTLEVLGKLTFTVCTGYIVDSVGYNISFILFGVSAMAVFPLLTRFPGALEPHLNND